MTQILILFIIKPMTIYNESTLFNLDLSNWSLISETATCIFIFFKQEVFFFVDLLNLTPI